MKPRKLATNLSHAIEIARQRHIVTLHMSAYLLFSRHKRFCMMNIIEIAAYHSTNQCIDAAACI